MVGYIRHKINGLSSSVRVNPGTPRGNSVCHGQRNAVHNPYHQYMKAHADSDSLIPIITVMSIEHEKVAEEALETILKAWERPTHCDHHSHALQDSDGTVSEVESVI
jgi:hypothetical protein